MRRLLLPVIIIGLTGCNLLTESKPVTVVAPESKPSNLETNDSSFFKLKVKEDRFEIEFLKKASVVNDINGLDSFFQQNSSLINKEKIVITGLDSAAKNKKLDDLLTKYNISRVRINTEENR